MAAEADQYGRNAGQKAGGKPEGLPHGDGTFSGFS
jgi:hypothetical protein